MLWGQLWFPEQVDKRQSPDAGGGREREAGTQSLTLPWVLQGHSRSLTLIKHTKHASEEQWDICVRVCGIVSMWEGRREIYLEIFISENGKKPQPSGRRKVCFSNHFLWYLDFGLTSFLLYLFMVKHQDMIHYLWYVSGMFVVNLNHVLHLSIHLVLTSK